MFYLMRGVTQNRTIQHPANRPIALVSDPNISRNDPCVTPRIRVGHFPTEMVKLKEKVIGNGEAKGIGVEMDIIIL